MAWRWSWSSLIFLVWGCSASRFLSPQDQLVAREPLLRGHVIEETPPLYLRSNSRTLGIRLRLQLYWGGALLRYSPKPPWYVFRRMPKIRYYTYKLGQLLQEKLGEPPMLVSQRALERDVKLLEEAYLREGYFQVAVQAQVKPLSKYEAQVIYRIRPGPRWYIRELDIEGEDSTLVSLAESFLQRRLLPVNEAYSLRRLDALREEVHQMLLSEGYYKLPLSQILWEVDTTTEFSNLKKPRGFLRRWIGKAKEDAPTCVVRLVLPSGFTRYQMSTTEVAVHTPEHLPTLESVHGSIRILTEGRALRIIDPRVFVSRIYLPSQGYYDQRAIQSSQRGLQSLEIVQWVAPSLQEDSVQSLRTRYDILLRPPIEVVWSVEGFQSTQPLVGSLPLPGASMTGRFSHISLFRRGLSFRIRGQAAISYFRRRPEEPLLPLHNLGGELSLTIPEGSLQLRQASARLLSSTIRSITHVITASYQDIRQVDFSRRYINFSWSRQTRFLFQDKRQEEQTWTPLGLTFVDSRFSDFFLGQIDALSPQVRSLILRDYLPRLTQITAWQVSSNRNYFSGGARRRGDYSSLLIELGGWVPFFLEHFLVLSRPQWDSTYQDNMLLNRFRYGVFIRVLAEGRLRLRLISPRQQLFVRSRVGLAQGGFYTLDVPFENRFFVGGPNSMRAWQFGALGPGRYTYTQNLFLIPGGTFLLEANAEIRQTLFRGIQLAPFIDVGNVWFLTDTYFEDARGIFGKSPWPGIGLGIGLRWDFSVLVIRLDVAQQVFDPAGGWVLRNFPVGGIRSQYVFAVGYPF